tara:strand:+ start:49 stop:909 length:861 start_codon:yes stop_codon:yes gene_type:complete
MEQLKIFIELTRLNKPIGYMLLFWPCSWGLAFGLLPDKNLEIFINYLLLFFIGSILMRSAGCIINDIVDKEFDKKVKRTKQRPIASKRISIELSFFYAFALCVIAFFILIQFNFLTIVLGFSSMFLAFAYPFMKRITYWPQLFLGLTFNWGIIMAWTSMNNYISFEIVLLYFSAIFWTLGYDTIYGVQDMSDDEIIGVKSTSIKFKNNIKMFVAAIYSLSIGILLLLFYKDLGFNILTLFLIFYILSLFFQVLKFKKNKPSTCLNAFKLNNFSGLILFLTILITKI